MSEDASHVRVLGTVSQAGPPPGAEALRWDEIGHVHRGGRERVGVRDGRVEGARVKRHQEANSRRTW